MTEPEDSNHALTPILLRFSSESTTIRRLVLEDEGFRSLVEDYNLALTTLRRLKRQTSPSRSRIDEYVSIVHDLEEEVSAYLARLRGTDR